MLVFDKSNKTFTEMRFATFNCGKNMIIPSYMQSVWRHRNIFTPIMYKISFWWIFFNFNLSDQNAVSSKINSGGRYSKKLYVQQKSFRFIEEKTQTENYLSSHSYAENCRSRKFCRWFHNRICRLSFSKAAYVYNLFRNNTRFSWTISFG